MEKVIVGKGQDCKVQDVVFEILQTPTNLSSCTVLQIIRMLGTDAVVQEKVMKNLEEGSASTYDVLENVLESWAAKTTTVASLDKLIYVLRKCDLGDTAERIRKKFCMNISKSEITVPKVKKHVKNKPKSFDCGLIKIVYSNNKHLDNQSLKPISPHHAIKIDDGWMCPNHKAFNYAISKLLVLFQIVSVFTFILIVIFVLKTA